jgi:hypothetical protein
MKDMKELVCSWDSECGCSIQHIQQEIRTIQQRHGLRAYDGYITTFENDHGTIFMVFSWGWITQEEAKVFVSSYLSKYCSFMRKV